MKIIAVVVAIVVLIYATVCWIQPFVQCHWCSGSGQRPSMAWRLVRRHVMVPCRPCGRTGRQLRIGRRAWNWVARTATGAIR